MSRNFPVGTTTRDETQPTEIERKLLDTLYACNRLLDHADNLHLDPILACRDQCWELLKRTGWIVGES